MNCYDEDLAIKEIEIRYQLLNANIKSLYYIPEHIANERSYTLFYHNVRITYALKLKNAFKQA